MKLFIGFLVGFATVGLAQTITAEVELFDGPSCTGGSIFADAEFEEDSLGGVDTLSGAFASAVLISNGGSEFNVGVCGAGLSCAESNAEFDVTGTECLEFGGGINIDKICLGEGCSSS
jgi:hypothetical protein